MLSDGRIAMLARLAHALSLSPAAREGFSGRDRASDRGAQPVGGIYLRFGKRALDVTLALLALCSLAPLMVAIAALVAMDGGGLLVRERRLGRGGQPIDLWRFRTTVRDPDRLLMAYLTEDREARLEWDATGRLRKDPRVTRLGAFLRRSGLDRLPMLWNVLIGDLALVGPAPLMAADRIDHLRGGRLAVRPALVPFGARKGGAAPRRDDDLRYLEEASLAGDLGDLVAAVARWVGLRTG